MKYLILLLPIMASCSYGVYAPASQNVPLLQQKGEAKLEISTGYLQGAMAVGKHIGLLATVQRASGEIFLNPYYGVTKHRRLEVGAGYFDQLKTNPNIIVEAYAGMGYDWLKWDFKRNSNSPIDSNGNSPQYPPENGNITYSLPNWNVFVQPAIGYRGKRASIAFSVKLNYMGYGLAQQRPYNSLYVSASNDSFVSDLTQWQELRPLWAEPALTFHTGRKRIRFALQTFYSFSIPDQHSRLPAYDGQVLNLRAYFIRLGLCFQLNKPLSGHH